MRTLKLHNAQPAPKRNNTLSSQDELLPDNSLADRSLIMEEPTHYKSIYHSESPKDGLTNQVYYLDDEIPVDKQPISKLSPPKVAELKMNNLIVNGLLWSAEPAPNYSTNPNTGSLQDNTGLHRTALHQTEPAQTAPYQTAPYQTAPAQTELLKTSLAKTAIRNSNEIHNNLNNEESFTHGKDATIEFRPTITQPISLRKAKGKSRVGSYFGIPEIDKVFKDYFPRCEAGAYDSLESKDRINKISHKYDQHHYGFPLGTIHAWHPLSLDTGIDVPHGLTIVTILARNAIKEDLCVFWIGNECWPTPYAFLLPTGINQSLINRLNHNQEAYKDLSNSSYLTLANEESANPKARFSGELLVKRSIFLNPKEGKDTLSCIESCLTSSSGNIVIAHISKKTAKQLEFSTVRRLSIAARESNTLGYLVCEEPVQKRSFSFNSSWGVKTSLSSDSTQSWQLALHKIKGALPEVREWRITLHNYQAKISLDESCILNRNPEAIANFATK